MCWVTNFTATTEVFVQVVFWCAQLCKRWNERTNTTPQTTRATTAMAAPPPTANNTNTLLVIESQRPNNTLLFPGERDHDDSDPNIDFVVDGLDKPLRLHTQVLGPVSGFVRDIIKCNRTNGSGGAAHTITWPFNTSNKQDQEALVMVLRFCYGAALRVVPSMVCPVVAALWRLDVRDAGDVCSRLCVFAVDVAQRDVVCGAGMLRQCVGYAECCSSQHTQLDVLLGKAVLTKHNMEAHFEEVVEKCVVDLPVRLLDVAQFGDNHTRCSEFNVRVLFVEHNTKVLTDEEKRGVLGNVGVLALNGAEVDRLRGLGVLTPDELVDVVIGVVKQQDEQLAVKNKEVAVKNKEVEEAHKQTTKTRQKLTEKERQLAQKDKQLAKAKEQEADKERQLAEVRQQAAQKDKQCSDKVAEMKRQVAEARQQAAQTKEQLEKKDRELAETREQMIRVAARLLGGQLENKGSGRVGSNFRGEQPSPHRC